MAKYLGRPMSYYLQEGSMLKDWGKIRTAAKEEGDFFATQLVWAFDYDPWDEQSRIGLKTVGRMDGARIGMADAEADEIIEDKAELKERALKASETWWKEQEWLFTQDYGIWPIEDINPDIDEIKRVYKTGFVEAYQKAAEKVKRGENASPSETLKELPNPFAALPPIEMDRDPLEPKSLRPSSDANDYTPRQSYGSSAIQEVATEKGTSMASSHYPYAVIEDVRESRIFARDICADWWSGLTNKEYNREDFPEVRRIFVSSFVKAYMESVDSKSADSGRWKNTQAPEQEDVVVRIRTQDQISDGVTYTVEFLDSDRMSQAVSFGITVKTDGAVEIEEV